ncbi:putative selenate ABC transporter substrate-binding protein [Ferrimonas balearica]|uniref:putative selenate ABC transporter substrate-binding protein n=1 Tax=Ferrimonas balearica TaxID=44012 RepID=UPI001C997E4C|nr:putative selenate ABC transporter substrate-binding protein [Ferrimonas balearica]MBY5920174.1 putative selenate ABC transporter substrate-binding protein [Ferrimonas balearica]MBY5997141.1 putative selenate ABC transporter substrate-binding protein [Ferrimonas balearica]
MIRALLVAVVLLLSVQAGAETLYFTAIPDQDERKLRTRFEQVAEYLSDTLEVEVRYLPVKSYSAAVTAFRNNQVQLAWFGGLSGLQARRMVPGSQAIAQGYEDQFFRTYFVVNTKTGLAHQRELKREDLMGLSFTYGAKGSTSGRLMPQYYIEKYLGKDSEIFSRVGFSGDHSRTLAQVQAGVYDAGAVNYKVWQQAIRDGQVDPAKIKVMWETPPYPDYHWTVRGDLDRRFGEGFSARVKAALLAMSDPDLLAAFPRQGFVEASNEDYQPIAEVAEAIGLLR